MGRSGGDAQAEMQKMAKGLPPGLSENNQAMFGEEDRGARLS